MEYFNESLDRVLDAIEKTIPEYRFDQYMLYPSVDKNFWQKFLLQRLSNALQSEEGSFFFEIDDGFIYLAGCRISQWDEAHFGFKMAMINWLIYPDTKMSRTKMDKLLGDCISFLRDNDVKFVSAHISGEDLLALHLLEDKGFRYYQTTAYPIAQCTNLPYKTDPNVRLWQETDLATVMQFAKHNQFRYGHYYCDNKFDKKTVDLMYEKWIRTSWNNEDPIAVIEYEGKVAGYFAFVMDDELSRGTKYKFGRMTSLAMDTSIRCKGLGSRLFRSVISIIGERGGEYVASEYSLKNYYSVRLHTKNLFYTVHEKVLLHLWL